jgi:hypothetical protein
MVVTYHYLNGYMIKEEDFRKQYEDINVPIKIGDILGGRFKNKKVVVKKIGKTRKVI